MPSELKDQEPSGDILEVVINDEYERIMPVLRSDIGFNDMIKFIDLKCKRHRVVIDYTKLKTDATRQYMDFYDAQGSMVFQAKSFGGHRWLLRIAAKYRN